MSFLPADRRVFLFLQGPPGTAFAELGRALSERGCEVRRINFNGGDLASWRKGVNYRSGLSGWPRYLGRALDAGVTDIVLFGDCRPMHRVALDMVEARGLRAHVFEEGYLRPDWVTLEIGGVNGRSRLPRSADWYRARAGATPPAQTLPGLSYAFASRARHTVAYYAACTALKPWFPFYRSHRPVHAAVETLGWLRKMALRGRAGAQTQRSLAALGERPRFLFPLQLDSDSQIRVHSRFRGMEAAIREVVASFARYAPADASLLVKAHPLDNGLQDWRRLTAAIAREHGAAGRMVFAEVGDIDAMVRDAIGVVTVNSTTGALALAAGKPTKTLGGAVYDLAGLTHQGSLDSFWTAPQGPDAELYQAFRRVLAAVCLVPGGFFAPEAVARLVDHAVPKLINAATLAAPVPMAAE